MKTFIEEYGIAIFAMICIIFLIVIASPVSNIIKDSINNVVDAFATKTTTGVNAINFPTL